MSVEPSIPLPLDPLPPPEADDKRLWIGNIDSRLTEYSLLKIVQQFGQIKKFDFLFHKSGVLKGQPRGYSFVTYETREQAEKALVSLNGKRALDKNLVVKWAHTVPSEAPVKKIGQSLASSDETKQTKNIVHQILAIEAKLKAMEAQRDKELEMCLSAIPARGDNPVLALKKSVTSHHKPRSVPYNRHERKNFNVHKSYLQSPFTLCITGKSLPGPKCMIY
ncbi:probable RNA-binding protein 18 isoform X3 [Stegodyphus dumicola]|uniref:probable RNA-binding protein 18 isoform X3 n=2 Tax=Stegodyphus dumicola TaxID=202533 RepID=UPI0015AA48C0|nr:probable RNA-binding protein 18 isoform X3 [Stegodyphus dumicola]